MKPDFGDAEKRKMRDLLGMDAFRYFEEIMDYKKEEHVQRLIKCDSKKESDRHRGKIEAYDTIMNLFENFSR